MLQITVVERSTLASYELQTHFTTGSITTTTVSTFQQVKLHLQYNRIVWHLLAGISDQYILPVW